jgi:hypothetical protein
VRIDKRIGEEDHVLKVLNECIYAIKLVVVKAGDNDSLLNGGARAECHGISDCNDFFDDRDL